MGIFKQLESLPTGDAVPLAAVLDELPWNPDGLLPAIAQQYDSGQVLVGVNTRDLRTLQVDPDRLRLLSPELPNAFCVAESGLHTAEDAAAAATLGYRLGLVGTALMRSDDPAALVAAMCAAGRARFEV